MTPSQSTDDLVKRYTGLLLDTAPHDAPPQDTTYVLASDYDALQERLQGELAARDKTIEAIREKLDAIAEALDDGLGDSDEESYEDDEDHRESFPVQWACKEVNELLVSIDAARSEGGKQT